MRLPLVVLSLSAALVAAPAPKSALVTEIRSLIDRDDFTAAEARLREYHSKQGATSELAAAMSWLGRGALARHRLDSADHYVEQTRKLVADLLKGRSVDEDRFLATALGAAIEVDAQVMAKRHENSQAIDMLEREFERYRDTSLAIRIQKNLHLLKLEGRPAPALDMSQYVGSKPAALASLKGHPVLLYFWAHWCPDCKAMAPVLARLQSEFGPKGLKFCMPTALYGYTKRGEDATPAEELRYIEKVRDEVYTGLGDAWVPVNEKNLRLYGSSTVPTFVLVDRQGLVQLYHPDVMRYEELATKIEALLR